MLTNSAYDSLWGVEPGRTLGTVTVLDSVRRWQELALPNPAFGDIRDFVGAFDERAEWTADLALQSGEMIGCRVVPLSGGATLVGFCRTRVAKSPLRRLRRQPRDLRTEIPETLPL